MRKLITILLGCMLSAPLMAQSGSGWRIAYNLNEIQGDFGQGIQIETPSIIKDYFTLKIRGSHMDLIYDLNGKNEWTPYFTAGLGLSSTPSYITKKISLYGEGGVMSIFPNSKFASPQTVWGGYGLFGFNFDFARSFCYFMELGGIGSGAVADRSDNERIYSNGFMMQVGFKVHFVPKEK